MLNYDHFIRRRFVECERKKIGEFFLDTLRGMIHKLRFGMCEAFRLF